MITPEKLPEEKEAKYFIDMAWLPFRKRSFSALGGSRLCPQSQEGLRPTSAEEPEAILTTIKECCCQKENFIHIGQPVLESIFRLLLSNDNQPLSLAEIGYLLEKHRGMKPPPVSILERLLKKAEDYYGLRPVPGA